MQGTQSELAHTLPMLVGTEPIIRRVIATVNVTRRYHALLSVTRTTMPTEQITSIPAGIPAGNAVRLAVQFLDEEDHPISPAPVELQVWYPDGKTEQPATVIDGEGAHHCDIVVTKPGRTTYEWTATGAIVVAEPGVFWVTGPK